MMPLINIGVILLFSIRVLFDQRKKRYSPDTQASFGQVLKILRLTISAFLTAMVLLVYAFALGWKVDMLRMSTLGMLVLFAIIGNFLPKLRPNRYAGIRTPWTVKSPEIWIRTHRLFGRIQLIGSLVLMPLCLFLPSAWEVFMLIGFILLTTFGAVVYSYICHRTLAAS